MKYVKFKDMIFQMVECPDDVQINEEISEENVFLSKVSETPKSSNVKKNCPLKWATSTLMGHCFSVNNSGKRTWKKEEQFKTSYIMSASFASDGKVPRNMTALCIHALDVDLAITYCCVILTNAKAMFLTMI